MSIETTLIEITWETVRKKQVLNHFIRSKISPEENIDSKYHSVADIWTHREELAEQYGHATIDSFLYKAAKNIPEPHIDDDGNHVPGLTLDQKAELIQGIQYNDMIKYLAARDVEGLTREQRYEVMKTATDAEWLYSAALNVDLTREQRFKLARKINPINPLTDEINTVIGGYLMKVVRTIDFTDNQRRVLLNKFSDENYNNAAKPYVHEPAH